MRTSLFVNATDALISDNVILAKPRQETTEVKNRLLDGSWHIQTVGDPAHSFELEFVVLATAQETIDALAANKTPLRLHRHGADYIGIIDGNPDWEQLIGSTDPARARYRCRILLLVTGGD
jgi:hypothetical protein